jgi:hypothetical protein
MSLESDLNKIETFYDAQDLFESKIFELKKRDVYKKSNKLFRQRVERLRFDINETLVKKGIDGELKEYDWFRDRYYFEYLYIGIFIWVILYLSMVLFLTGHDPNESSNKSVRNESETTSITTVADDTNSGLVWNKYRQSYTSNDIFRQDENWSSANN